MATREELLQAVSWRRALAAKARSLALEMTGDIEHKALLRYAADLEAQADEAQAQADAIAKPN